MIKYDNYMVFINWFTENDLSINFINWLTENNETKKLVLSREY